MRISVVVLIINKQNINHQYAIIVMYVVNIWLSRILNYFVFIIETNIERKVSKIFYINQSPTIVCLILYVFCILLKSTVVKLNDK